MPGQGQSACQAARGRPGLRRCAGGSRPAGRADVPQGVHVGTMARRWSKSADSSNRRCSSRRCGLARRPAPLRRPVLERRQSCAASGPRRHTSAEREVWAGGLLARERPVRDAPRPSRSPGHQHALTATCDIWTRSPSGRRSLPPLRVVHVAVRHLDEAIRRDEWVNGHAAGPCVQQPVHRRPAADECAETVASPRSASSSSAAHLLSQRLLCDERASCPGR